MGVALPGCRSPQEAARARALFAAMDNARNLRAADRLSRDQAHER
jgi:hypothetical protein